MKLKDELSNHLGNVLVVVSDRLLASTSDGLNVDEFSADIMSANDYYPFGSEMVGRKITGGYRFGYQGSEKDNEVSGDGNSYTTEFRQLDPRLGRWFSVDPWAQKYPYISPYSSMHNNPINLTDVRGLGPDGDATQVAVENDGLPHSDPAGDAHVFNPSEIKTLQIAETSGYITLLSGTRVYVMEGDVTGYWDKDNVYHAGCWRHNNGISTFGGFENGVGNTTSSKDSYFIGGIPENFKGESTKVACGNVERESVMGDDFKGDPLNLEPKEESSFDWYKATKDVNGVAGAAATIVENARYSEVIPGKSTGAGWWRDKMGKFRSLKTPGNGTTGGKINFAKAATKTAKLLGKITFGATVVFSVVDASNAIATNDKNKVGVVTKAGLDVVMGAIGVWGGPIGGAIAIGYFVGDYFGWWGDWGSPQGPAEHQSTVSPNQNLMTH